MSLLDTVKGLFASAPPVPPKEAPQRRGDGWENNFTGLGVAARDKMMQGAYQPDLRLLDVELSSSYHGNDICGKIVDFRPREMFREGYDLVVEGDPDEASELADAAEELRVNELVRDAMIWGRLYGGCLLILGIDDGRLPTQPLNEDGIRAFRFLNIVDRRFCYVATYYSDPLQPKFGQPQTYQIVNAFGAAVTEIHETRVIRFDGAPADPLKRRELAGWTYSVLQRPYETIRAVANSFQASANLLSDASQGVFKMQGLIDMIAGGEQTNLQTRMQLVDMMRSAGRALVIDAEGEDFTRQPTPMGGIPEMLDRFMMRLSAASDIPVTILFGRSAAGMNATGDADFRAFYATVQSDQKNTLTPVLKRIFALICKGRGQDVPALDFAYRPLWTPTDQEQAATEKTVAEKDAIYIDKGVLLPEEVALARYATGKFSATTTLSPEAIAAREKALADESRFEPPPAMPPTPQDIGAEDPEPIVQPNGRV